MQGNGRLIEAIWHRFEEGKSTLLWETKRGDIVAVPGVIRAFPPAFAWRRIQQLHSLARAAGVDRTTYKQLYTKAVTCAMAQLAVVPRGAVARLLGSLVDYVSVTMTIDGLEPIFV